MALSQELRSVLSVAVLVFLGELISPAGCAGQVRLIPHVGLYAPMENLGSVRSTAPSEAVEIGKKESTFALGLGVEFGGPPRSLGLRGNVVHATSSDVPLKAVGCAACEARSTVTALTVTLVARPFPRSSIQPYVLGGAGIKRYDFDEDRLRDEGFEALVGDQNRTTGHVGVGLELRLGGFAIAVECSDLLSSFDLEGEGDGEFQNDFFLTVGVVLGG
jgi:hypothetical protein